LGSSSPFFDDMNYNTIYKKVNWFDGQLDLLNLHLNI
jgi:hypothetical protein